jgi:hypothetical protein
MSARQKPRIWPLLNVRVAGDGSGWSVNGRLPPDPARPRTAWTPRRPFPRSSLSEQPFPHTVLRACGGSAEPSRFSYFRQSAGSGQHGRGTGPPPETKDRNRPCPHLSRKRFKKGLRLTPPRAECSALIPAALAARTASMSRGGSRPHSAQSDRLLVRATNLNVNCSAPAALDDRRADEGVFLVFVPYHAD